MKKIYTYTILVLAVFGLSACSGAVQHMKIASKSETIKQAPKGKAQVVFLRPGSYGFQLQSSVFDVNAETRKIVGIVPARAKVAYQTEPGEHLFMVFGHGDVSLMSATLEEGKTYYVLIKASVGAFGTDFALEPVQKDEVSDEEIEDWLKSCQLLEVSQNTYVWANEKKDAIAEMYKDAYEDWMDESIEDRPKLEIEDGR